MEPAVAALRYLGCVVAAVAYAGPVGIYRFMNLRKYWVIN